MKQIPALLLESYKQPTRSTCFFIKIVSKVDPTKVYPFTSHDAAKKFNDGQHDLWYRPSNTMFPQNLQSSSDMDVDNTELHGWFDDVVAQAVDVGLIGGAEVTIYRVNYLHLEYGAEVVSHGVVGRIEFAAGKQGTRKIEFKGLEHKLKTKKNDMYSLTCRHDFGDDDCGMPFVWHVGEIVEVDNQYLRFRVSGVAQPDDYFNLGVVRFTDGDNANAELEIEEWDADGWIKLSFVTPYPMLVGVGVMPRRDCIKTDAACIEYGNIIRMGAEHLTPVQDQSIMVPGAYVKSNNAL